MALHFVRHGETDFNARGRLQGPIIDEPINANGARQIRELVPALPEFELIFSSPLKRARMSAEIIARATGKALVLREDLSERSFGSLAGKTWDEIPDGEALRLADRELRYDYRPYGGEAVEDVEARLRSFFRDAEATGYASVLAVSSMGIIRLAYKLKLGRAVAHIANASLHSFR
ncbi:MAG TPA: histidine phosphatase family protein [Burkholderiales bacterium]|nr:histidine phosphatase family protein [Burkholderiales bacterium]